MANSLKKEVRKAIGPSSKWKWQPVAFCLCVCTLFVHTFFVENNIVVIEWTNDDNEGKGDF